MYCVFCFFFFFKQKTAYEIYQCDWSSDVCSSDLAGYETATTSCRHEFMECLEDAGMIKNSGDKKDRPIVGLHGMNTTLRAGGRPALLLIKGDHYEE